MKEVIIFQQGSGSRILSAYLWGEVAPEPFAEKPPKTLEEAGEIVEKHDKLRLSYRHLDAHPFLVELLKDWRVIHLYRDPARTWTREVAKYDLTVTKKDLKAHIDYVLAKREEVNDWFNNVTITHYEDIIRDLYLGDIKEFQHL